MLESEAAAPEAAANQVGSNRESLKGIKSVSVTIEDSDSSDDKCRPANTNNGLRLAAIGSSIDGGIKVVADDLVSPALSVNVTALSISAGGCAAFLSVSLRDLPYATPGYKRAPQVVGNKLLEAGILFISPRSEFTERISDQLRRSVDGFVTQIKVVNQPN